MNIDMIRAARARLEGHARYTPLLTSPFLDEIAGRRVWVKPECLQHTGSFKFRGGWSAISAMSPEDRARGVIAFSSGNHGQGVALAAARHGAPAVIVMPSDAPKMKIDNTRALGADVVLYDRATENRDEITARLAGERGLTLIKPFDEPLVIAGQGTCGLEIAEQAAEKGIAGADVLVCCGGGGLASGVAAGAGSRGAGPARSGRRNRKGFDDMARSLRSGRIERNSELSGSLCDAILTPQPGELTFPILRRLAGPGIVATEDEALEAVALAFSRLKIVAEPGGAVALAAALFHGEEIEGDDVIVTVSGGNVDAEVFRLALERFGG
jgi:threonine dehydratase